MAMASAHQDPVSTGHSRKRVLLGIGGTLILIVALVAVAALVFSGVTLAGDSTALARGDGGAVGWTHRARRGIWTWRPEAATRDRWWALDSPGEADSGRAGGRWTWKFAGRDGSAGRWGQQAQRAADAARPGLRT